MNAYSVMLLLVSREKVFVAHAQWDDLNVHLRHGGQKSGDARTLFLRVDTNMDRIWRVFLHGLYGFPSF
jgi:hypothetical protein